MTFWGLVIQGQLKNQYWRTAVTDILLKADGVVVGVLIGSIERYDLVKIKPTESEAEY